MTHTMKLVILAVVALLLVPLMPLRATDSAKPVKVFIFAGQSNMEGAGFSRPTRSATKADGAWNSW